MSESRPPFRDRTAIIAALITAGASVLVALIGFLPNLLNQRASPSSGVPTIIIITATPLVAPETTTPPVPTPAAIPPSATPIPPTQTSVPETPTAAPAAPTSTTDIPVPILDQACTRATLAAGLETATITFVLANNFEKDQDFYLDDCLAARVDSASYEIFSVRPGTYELKNCLRGADPIQNPQDCSANRRSLTANPYDWEIYGNALPKDNPTLLVLNRTETDIGVFVDGDLAVTASVNSHTAGAVPVRHSAAHSIIVCSQDIPFFETDQCNEPATIQGGKAILFLIVETIK